MDIVIHSRFCRNHVSTFMNDSLFLNFDERIEEYFRLTQDYLHDVNAQVTKSLLFFF